MCTLTGDVILSILFRLPSEKGSTQKGNNLRPFRVDLFSEGDFSA